MISAPKNLRLHVVLAASLIASSAFASGSLDRFSPTFDPLGPCTGSPADSYDHVGVGTGGCDAGGAPVLDMPPGDYGLLANDNVNAFSNNEADPAFNHLLLFSGDWTARGLAGTPFRNQANNNQVVGDVFRTLGTPSAAPSAMFPILGGCAAPATIGTPHALHHNQTRYNLIPTVGPAVANPYLPSPGWGRADNLDALEIGGFDVTGDVQHDYPVYFALDRVSPSLGGTEAADIFTSAVGAVTFAPFANIFDMGLQQGDDMDGLAIWDRGVVGNLDRGTDYAIFSLDPNSPTLAGPDGIWGTADDLSPADVLITNFNGFFCLYVTANELQMRFQDNVDALDVIVLP